MKLGLSDLCVITLTYFTCAGGTVPVFMLGQPKLARQKPGCHWPSEGDGRASVPGRTGGELGSGSSSKSKQTHPFGSPPWVNLILLCRLPLYPLEQRV